MKVAHGQALDSKPAALLAPAVVRMASGGRFGWMSMGFVC